VELYTQLWSPQVWYINLDHNDGILLGFSTHRRTPDIHCCIAHNFPPGRLSMGKMDVVLSGKTLLKITRLQ